MSFTNVISWHICCSARRDGCCGMSQAAFHRFEEENKKDDRHLKQLLLNEQWTTNEREQVIIDNRKQRVLKCSTIEGKKAGKDGLSERQMMPKIQKNWSIQEMGTIRITKKVMHFIRWRERKKEKGYRQKEGVTCLGIDIERNSIHITLQCKIPTRHQANSLESN